jgi:alkaline phosphatase D
VLAQQVVMAELDLHPGPRCTVLRQRWYADLRVVNTVERPGAPVRTLARYVMETGRPGAEQV